MKFVNFTLRTLFLSQICIALLMWGCRVTDNGVRLLPLTCPACGYRWHQSSTPPRKPGESMGFGCPNVNCNGVAAITFEEWCRYSDE